MAGFGRRTRFAMDEVWESRSPETQDGSSTDPKGDINTENEENEEP